MKFRHLLFSLYRKLNFGKLTSRRLMLLPSFLLFQVGLYSQSIGTFNIQTPSKGNSILEIAVRVPGGYSRQAAGKFGVLVLFGGRNWEGRRTIETYRFNEFADRYGMFIVSPSFKDDEYWQPEKWSGKALLDTLDKIYEKYGLDRKKKIFCYGYSAGAQCVNLFLAWKPEIVEAWSLHACGVWLDPDNSRSLKAPGLATCGELDIGRRELSISRIAKMRENGCTVIWKSFPGEGHGLPGAALKLAEAFFESCISNPERKIKFVGDDQLMRYFPIESKEVKFIDEGGRNEFYDEKLAGMWGGK
ncbi:MAG: hypothetical protein WCS96_11095 [Victivallales bacterium]|jgi:hypothetical protein